MVKIFGFEISKTHAETEEYIPVSIPTVSVNGLSPYSFAAQSSVVPPASYSLFNGEKFPGGFGDTILYEMDYWTLRARSSQLFNENLYARGLIRRLITNEINVGLTPEAAPESEILKINEDSLSDWSENIETRFSIWANNPKLCDYFGVDDFGAIQRDARRESLIEGDVLVVMHSDASTGLPKIQLIKGSAIKTPLFDNRKLKNSHEIHDGVEIDSKGRIVAFWVLQKGDNFNEFKRLSAYGERSGRKIAWLEYGTEKRVGLYRGMPLLSLMLQSLKEIDRYRDSTQRKALVNSILAMFISKDQDKIGSLPITGGAVRKDKNTVTDSDGTTRSFNIANQIPGVVIEELQHGETPHAFGSQGTDVNFKEFEIAVISSIAWANEIPPECLILGYTKSFNASQAAINEFKIYIDLVWRRFGASFCTPIYVDWMISEALQRKINVPRFLESWRNPQMYDIFGAWTSVDWYGSIKPTTDMLKQAKGSQLLIDECLSTHAREARITTGTKFSRNIKRLKRENELKVEARRPIAEFQKEFGLQIDEMNPNNTGNALAIDIESLIEDTIESRA